MKIKKNIALCYVKLGAFGKAIEAYEDIINDSPEFEICFNLLVCVYALGDKIKMKSYFEKMLMIDLPGAEEEETEEILQMQATEEEKEKLQSLDPLKEYLKEKKKFAMRFIVDSAKLIVGSIEEDMISGYDWIIAMLKTANLQEIESEIEICKAVNFIKQK